MTRSPRTGSCSSPASTQWGFARQADQLSTMFADFTVELYDERHHLARIHR